MMNDGREVLTSFQRQTAWKSAALAAAEIFGGGGAILPGVFIIVFGVVDPLSQPRSSNLQGVGGVGGLVTVDTVPQPFGPAAPPPGQILPMGTHVSLTRWVPAAQFSGSTGSVVGGVVSSVGEGCGTQAAPEATVPVGQHWRLDVSCAGGQGFCCGGHTSPLARLPPGHWQTPVGPTLAPVGH